MTDYPLVPGRRTMRCAVAVAVAVVALAASVTAGAPATASTSAHAATTPCTPDGSAAEQPVSPSVAALGNDERQEIVVYRGVGAAAGCLITARSDTGVSVHRLGIAKSSVPVVAEIGGAKIRYQIAFQANTGHLWTTGDLGTHSTPLLMAAGTSPDVASGTGDIAFQANTGNLWTTGDNIGTRSLRLAMAAGTNPSINALPGGHRIAYQGANHHLWVTDLISSGKPVTVTGHDLGLGMMPGTSPSLSSAGNGYQIAFQANTGLLWTTGEDGRRNLRYGMSRLSSPSSYRDEIVVTSNRNQIYDVTDTGTKIQVLPLASSPGSTPSLTLLATPGPAGAHRQYSQQIAYAAQITGGTPAELTAGVINRLYDIP